MSGIGRPGKMGRPAPGGIKVQKYGSVTTCKKEPPTMSITRIGLDTAKAVFQVHGVDETEKATTKRKLQRSEMIPFFERSSSRAQFTWKRAGPGTIGLAC